MSHAILRRLHGHLRKDANGHGGSSLSDAQIEKCRAGFFLKFSA